MSYDRLDAAAAAIYDRDYDYGFNAAESEGLADAALTAGDKVMFSDEAIERAAEALCVSIGKVDGLWWMHSDKTKDAYRTHARAVIAALKDGSA